MIRELWRALGIDPEITPNHLTLGEIGIESMFAVELQQELERDWNTKVSLNQVKSITIGMLKDYEVGAVGEIKKHLDDIKRARLALLKLNFVMPTQTHTPLNTVTKGTPIYFMPPILVSFGAMEELAQRINRPVIGLNWTREVSALTTMKAVTAYYVKLLKTLEPKGKCDVLGYFDGAIICSKYLLKGMVGRAVIIDVINDTRFRDEFMTDEYILEYLLSFLSNAIPDSFREKILRDLKKEQGMSGKLKFIVNELGDFAGKGLVATDMEEIFEVMISRIQMLSKYRMEKKKKLSNKLKTTIGKKWSTKTGKLVIIKPFQFELCEDVDETMEKARDTYFLPGSNEQGMSGKLKFIVNELGDFAGKGLLLCALVLMGLVAGMWCRCGTDGKCPSGQCCMLDIHTITESCVTHVKKGDGGCGPRQTGYCCVKGLLADQGVCNDLLPKGTSCKNTYCHILCLSRESTPTVGSSNITSLGLCNIVMAIDTRRCSPPLNTPISLDKSGKSNKRRKPSN
ncbi:unnamed protein product [Medioppia subpectinata]|uniref:Carrier domain-containing protein n=1 Tax=Medioppia subpectinata TaxID=1979941 RepID=A0A7R9KP07_9ACAR|nr:unnamed protein product [Medioppia subpectinata]CAG2106806.1 unnamed protein product [Medioppia subpectinata]